MRIGLSVVTATAVSCLLVASPVDAGDAPRDRGISHEAPLTPVIADSFDQALRHATEASDLRIEPRPTLDDGHRAPLPSAALAGIALLSMTAAHSFGRKRRGKARQE